MPEIPQIGDVLVTATGGWAARIIRWATGDPKGSPWAFWSRKPALVNHAAVHVGRQTFKYQGRQYVDEPAVAEGRPRGAGLAPLAVYPGAIWLQLPCTLEQGRYNALAAMAMLGTRYGWLNCLAIGLVRVFEWRAPKLALVILASRYWEECAQYADNAVTMGAEELEDAHPGVKGVRIFDDGRPPGLVSPRDLYDAAVALAAKRAHVSA